MVPEEWIYVPMGKLVEKVTRPVSVDTTGTYQEIGIRSHGKGLFDKEPVTGAALGNKRVFWIEPDCLILNIVFAWEQAVGRTTSKDHGKIASHRFPMYKPRAGRADIDYLTYLFKTPYGKHILGLASPGGAGRNKTLGQSDFLKTVVCVPSISAQRRIVEILKTWDKAIEILDRLIANSEARKQGLMQLFLSADHSSPEFRNTRTSIKPLKSVVEFIRDGTHGTHERLTDGIPLLSATNILSNGLVDFHDAPMISSSDYQKIHAKYEIQENDVLITVVGTLGRVAVVPKCQKFAVQRSVAIIRPGHTLDSRYMAHLARSFAFQLQLKKRANITAQSGVYLGELAKIPIPVIGLDDQRRIAGVLDRAEQECLYHAKLQASLRAQRTALMQQLVNKKRRMNAEEAVAPVAAIG